MKRRVAFTSLAVLLAAAVPSQGGILAHWKFDESNGPIAFASAGPWPGLLNGGAAFVPNAGVRGGAISLNQATNSFVYMGTILPFTTGDHSIQAWVKTEPGDRNDLIAVSRHQSGSLNGYMLAINGVNPVEHQNDKAGFYVSAQLNDVFFSQTTVNDGNWHQVVATLRNTGLAEIFVDGAPREDFRTGLAEGSNSAAFLVGGMNRPSPVGLYTGMIDDVQVYGHALNNAQVQFLFDHPSIELEDFNGNSVFDCADIDALVFQIAAQMHDPLFDLTGDDVVNLADRDAWLAVAGAAQIDSGASYLLGDANLDGIVDGSDFIIWNTNKFTPSAAWCSGDFNADGVVDGTDFMIWNSNKFRAADQSTAIPEPSTATWILAAATLVASHKRTLVLCQR